MVSDPPDSPDETRPPRPTLRDAAVHVGYKPGVTDPVAKSFRIAIEDTLGRSLGADAAVFTSRLFLFRGIDVAQAERIAGELLANPVIQTVRVCSHDDLLGSPPRLDVPRVAPHPRPKVLAVELSGAAAVAALMSGRVKPSKGACVAALLCGAGVAGLGS